MCTRYSILDAFLIQSFFDKENAQMCVALGSSLQLDRRYERETLIFKFCTLTNSVLNCQWQEGFSSLAQGQFSK